jgi:phage protein D
MTLGIVVTAGGAEQPDLAEASAVEVTETLGRPTRFRLVYPVDVAEGDITRVTDPRLGPEAELAILVDGGSGPECLVKGPVHAQRLTLRHGGEGSSLEVSGSDSSVRMGRETRSAVWADSTDGDAVTAIVATYGFRPDIRSTDTRHLESKHALVQRATDLEFVQSLARRNGYAFWVTADALGLETAHFRAPAATAVGPEPVLRINLDDPATTELELEWDVERPVSATARQLDLNNKAVIEGSAPESAELALGAEALATIVREPRSTHLPAPADDAGDLLARARAAVAEASWFVRATCRTSVDAAGTVVRAHRLIRLEGAGSRFSGKYLVAGVRHLIDAEAHRMELTLLRNAWGDA